MSNAREIAMKVIYDVEFNGAIFKYGIEKSFENGYAKTG